MIAELRWLTAPAPHLASDGGSPNFPFPIVPFALRFLVARSLPLVGGGFVLDDDTSGN